jgi:hypothetical protein
MLIASGDRLTAYGPFARPAPPRPETLSLRELSTPSRRPMVRTAPPPIARHASAPSGRIHLQRPNYWKRTWQQALSPRDRVLTVHGGSASDPPAVLCASQTVQAWNALTGEMQWELPLDDSAVWSAHVAAGLLIGTGDELCAVHPATGRVLWRVPWRAALHNAPQSSITDLQFHLLEHGVLVVALPVGFVWYDLHSASVRLARELSSDLHPQTAVVWKERLTFWSRRWGRREEWDFSGGSPRRTTSFIALRWAAPPQRDADNWVFTTDDRRLVWTTDDLQPLREYVAVASAHAEPWALPRPVPGDRESHLLLDGTTLLRLRWDGEHVWNRWSQTLVRTPLTTPSEQVAVQDNRIYAAAGGLLQAVDLMTGQTVWRQLVTLPDPLQVVCGPGWVSVLPLGSAPILSGVDLFAAETGERWQRIALSDAARQVQLHPHAAGLVVVTDREAIGLIAR